jgi:hypothetical protein
MRLLSCVILMLAIVPIAVVAPPAVATSAISTRGPVGSIAAAPPSNDDIGGATLIATFPSTTTLDTSEATTAPDDPPMLCGNDPNSATVWFRLPPSTDGRVTLDTFGSTYDTVIAVFGGAPGALTPIVCSDDVAGTRQSEIRFSARPGTDYFIDVAAYSTSAGGQLALAAHLQPPILVPMDIVLLQDETGSMADDIAALNQITPQIWDSIAEISRTEFRMGVVGFRDYAINPWGQGGDWVYRPVGDLSTDRIAFAQAVGNLTADQGGDIPESQYPAIKYLLTPDHPCIDSNNDGDCASNGDTPAGQQPAFRTGARRIILLATDAEAHTPTNTPGYPGPEQAEIIALLQRTHTTVIGLVPGGAGRLTSVDALAAATGGSVQDTGANGQAVADAIALALGELRAVSPTLSSITATPPTVAADGTAAITLTLTLRDTAGHPVPGKSVLLMSARGAFDNITQPAAPTDDNGRTVGVVRSTFAGSVSISAIDISDNVRIATPAAGTFTALTISPNETLRRQILMTDRYTREDLGSLADVATRAGDAGDDFVGAVTEDAAKLAIGIMLGFSKGIGGVKETVDATRPAVYMTYPGVASEDGWSAILRFQKAFPISGKLFDAAVRQGVQHSDWSGLSLTVLKGGIKYYAAGLFAEVADQLGEDAATDRLKDLAAGRGGLKTIAQYAAGGMRDQQQMLQIERDQLLNNIPPMDDARQNSFARDLSQRTIATMVEGAAYRRHAILLDSLHAAHDSIGNDGALGAVLRFTVSSMAGAAFDGPGKLLGDGLTTSFDTYINARKLSEAQRGVAEAISVLKGAPEAAARIYSNTATGYAQIRQNHPAVLVRGHIGAIRNYTQGSGAGPIWFEHNTYSDIEIFNDSDVAASFEVFANFGYNNHIFFGLFPYAYLPLVKTTVVRIGPHARAVARVYYREEERDGSPDDSSNVQFDVLASSDNGDSRFFIASAGTTWRNPQRAPMSASASVAEAAATNQTTVENPISSYVLSDPATQTYQAQFWIANPFTATITADITQPLPAGFSVVATNGAIIGNTITWQRAVAASDIVSATFTFRTTAAPGTKLSLPAATMAFVEPLSGQAVTTVSNSPSFTAVWPLTLVATVPLGRVGAHATMPVTITNLVSSSVSGQLAVTLDGTGGVHIPVTQLFSVPGRTTAIVAVRLPAVVRPGLYRLTISLQLPGAQPLVLNEVYEVRGRLMYLPFVTRR